tara:strand:+ start:9837 stop:10094 length:258 start_codon:yes stop_codon:yes gene_type:complete
MYLINKNDCFIMATRKVVIAVDEKFFNNIFEKQRRKLQRELGIMNLSQANFTKMIQEIKLTPIKKDKFNSKIQKRGIKKNDFFMF